MYIKFLLIFVVAIQLGACSNASGQAYTPRSAQSGSSRQQMQNCHPGAAADARRLCDEAVANQLKATSQTSVLDGGWRLVKTRDTSSSLETVSVMRAVDTARSDPNLAGLSLRCSETGIQVVLIVLSAIPRSSQPRVTIAAGRDRNEFQASVIQRGDALLLPNGAANLVNGDWQKASELSIEIEAQTSLIRGIVPIMELSAALRSLSAYCAVK